jgi:hypothetical protein
MNDLISGIKIVNARLILIGRGFKIRTELSQCMVRLIQRFSDMVPACNFRAEGKPKAFDPICPIHVCMKEFFEGDWCGSGSTVRKIV